MNDRAVPAPRCDRDRQRTAAKLPRVPTLFRFTSPALVRQFPPPLLLRRYLFPPQVPPSHANMNAHRASPSKSRAPPLKIKRRQSPTGRGTTSLLDRRLLLFLIALRTFNALTIRTFFQPDEYYQSLEPAWRFVFGYGELTWDWREGIRGFLYPSLFVSVWWIADILGIRDATVLVSSAPPLFFWKFADCGRLRCRIWCRLPLLDCVIFGRIVSQDAYSTRMLPSGRYNSSL